MDGGFGLFGRGCSPSPAASSSSSRTPRPQASPIGTPFSWCWDDDRPVGSNTGTGSSHPMSPFSNPRYYFTDILQSYFSGLSLSDGNIGRSFYNSDSAAIGRSSEVSRQRAIVYSNPDRSSFDASMPAVPPNLAEQGTNPFCLADRRIDFYSSSSSPLSGNLFSRGLVGSSSSTLLGGQMANGRLGRSLYDPSPSQLFQEQLPQLDRHTFPDNVPNGVRIHSNRFTSNGMTTRSISRRRLEIDTDIFNMDSSQLIWLCCSSQGARSVQGLLQKVKCPLSIANFMSGIRPGILDLIKDSNGYHVIQYCLNNFSAEQNEYILEEAIENCLDISRDISGCHVIQRCVDISEGHHRDRLLSEIIGCALPLVEDCYGNYVVQHVLALKNTKVNSKIWQMLSGCFVSLSGNKFASHVVENLLTGNDPFESSSIINELLQCPKLLVNTYGNYVIQTALSVAQGDTLRALCKMIEKNLPSMVFNKHGRMVIEAYQRIKAAARIDMYHSPSAWK